MYSEILTAIAQLLVTIIEILIKEDEWPQATCPRHMAAWDFFCSKMKAEKAANKSKLEEMIMAAEVGTMFYTREKLWLGLECKPEIN